MVDFYSKDRFKMNGETLDDYCHIIDEEIDSLEDDEIVFSKDGLRNISLSSFKPQKELNPKVWPNGKINSKVRVRLLKIADDFFDTLSVNWVEPVDVILTGSLSNYNWSKYSDFDLHIVIDFSEVDERTEFVKDYFDAKKKLWNENHENLKIFGFPVEVYVQDLNELHNASGIYSLERNQWIKKPERNSIKAIKLSKYFIKEKSLSIMDKIDSIEKEFESGNYEESSEKARKLFSKIKSIRKEALKNGDEMSSGNLIFKVLRRSGYIGKLSKIINSAYDGMYNLKH